jgi:shikimate dehydrogenase
VWDALPGDAPVLVLGAGGAAAAALLAVGPERAAVSARRPGAAAVAGAAFGVPSIPWGEAIDGAVVVNATPLGMEGEHLPEGLLAAASGLFDMAYGAQTTPAVAEMRRRGMPVIDGIDLLVAQAAGSFELWTGRAAPVAVMERAARRG